MLDLFVRDATSDEKVSTVVSAATEQNLAATNDLLDNYARMSGARRTTAYDPFRMIIWEDARERIVAEFRRNSNV